MQAEAVDAVGWPTLCPVSALRDTSLGVAASRGLEISRHKHWRSGDRQTLHAKPRVAMAEGFDPLLDLRLARCHPMIMRRPVLHIHSLPLIDVVKTRELILAAQRKVCCESRWTQSTIPESEC